MRKFFLILSTIILLTLLASLAGAGYLAGDYFVDYALKRGNSTNPYAPPPAYAATLGMKQGPAAAKPRFAAENWQLLSGMVSSWPPPILNPGRTVTAGLF